MTITILTVGKKPRGAEQELIEEYQKRIQKPWNIQWKVISHGQGDAVSAIKAESSLILEFITDEDYLIVLDERGELLDNKAFAQLLHTQNRLQHLKVVIGGAYGVDDRVRERANRVVSLSPLVFPHKLMRILLAEQLYRTQTILQGHPYHHT